MSSKNGSLKKSGKTSDNEASTQNTIIFTPVSVDTIRAYYALHLFAKPLKLSRN